MGVVGCAWPAVVRGRSHPDRAVLAPSQGVRAARAAMCTLGRRARTRHLTQKLRLCWTSTGSQSWAGEGPVPSPHLIVDCPRLPSLSHSSSSSSRLLLLLLLLLTPPPPPPPLYSSSSFSSSSSSSSSFPSPSPSSRSLPQS